jgi:hypothetical protein
MMEFGAAPPRGIELDYAEVASDLTTTSTAPVDADGLLVTFIAPATPVKLRFWCRGVKHSVAGSLVGVALTSGDGVTTYANKFADCRVTTGEYDADLEARLSALTPGQEYTFRVRFWAGTAGTATMKAVSGSRAFIEAVTT